MEQQTVIQTLVNNLTTLNMQLRTMADSLKKLENNEIEAFKNNYEFKYTVIGEIKNLGKELLNVQETFKGVVSKMDIKHESVDKALEDIKDTLKLLPETEATFKLAADCEECPILLEKDKNTKARLAEKDTWLKRLWGVVVVLGLAILALLGLNLFGIVKLPGIM